MSSQAGGGSGSPTSGVLGTLGGGTGSPSSGVPEALGGGTGSPSSGATVAGVVLALDPASAEPPFRQLRGQIVEAIRRGALSPGTRLPAVRALAEQVGVAPNTAAKVYRELEQAGLLESRGRSGTFIAEADMRSAVLLRAAEEFVEHACAADFTADEAIAAVRDVYSRMT